MGVDLCLLKQWKEVKGRMSDGSPEDVYNRVSNTVSRALARRHTGEIGTASGAWKSYNSILAEAHNGFIRASRGEQRPARFAGLPESDVIEVSVGGDTLMDDSAVGAALCKEEDCTKEQGFECGAQDVSGGKLMAYRTIKWEEAVPDRFELYRIGTVHLAPKAFVYTGWTWHTRISLNECHRPGGEKESWELWMSYKFEGPQVQGSKAKENRAWLDRVFLVRKRDVCFE